MHCPNCRFENREGVKFCGNCGAKFLILCPQCNAENPSENKFCNECGTPLSAPEKPLPKPPPSFNEKIAKVQHYLPKELAEKILAQRERIEGERKQVTVLFTDMAGYTSMTEKLDPEEAFGLMEQVYEILIRTVNEYGGTVNELKGDGVMALFGAPIALEDAPQRAIRASLTIHRELVQFNEKMRREKAGLPVLRMRAGIHTGQVVMGTLGNDLRVEFKVAGDTVNLASRMEAMAEPGSTYVTEDTFKLTEGLFRFEGLGEQEVKGKEKPICVYRVIAPSSSRTRFDVSAERGLTPFVGRERERELLLDAFDRARSGRGQAVSIVSEAGMGKSRLLYEFRKAVLNEDITFLEGKCLSFSRSVAYQPIIDILKSNFDIRDGDPDLGVRNKVKQGLKALNVEEGPSLPYIMELLSIQDSGLEKIAISQEEKKIRLTETIKTLILKGADARPLVIAIEDLHWIDKTSEDVIEYLLKGIAGARILLIITYRPEFIPTWGARSYHNQLLLNRLSNRESLFMATHILGREQIPPVPPLKKGGIEVAPSLLRGGIEVSAPLPNGGTEFGPPLLKGRTEGGPSLLKEGIEFIPPFLKGGGGDFRDSLGEVQLETALEEVILEKTEGIPFFVEEFIKSMKDLGFIERKDATYRIAKELHMIHIPSTIQDIIMARVDALPEGTKELLQVGSLIEREFPYKLIKAAMHLPEEELLRRFSFLKDAELLYERGLFPDSTFIFKHALTREVVYGTLLEKKKKELHIDIGHAIEEVYLDIPEEHAAELAEHFSYSSDSADLQKAVSYGEMAAKRATAVYAYGEAVKLLDQAIKVQEILGPEDKGKRCDLLLALCDALLLAVETKRILDTEAPAAFALAEALGDGSRACRACLVAILVIGMVAESGGGFATPQAAEWAKRADCYAKPDTTERAWADMALGATRFYAGHLRSGHKLLTQAVDLARRLGDPNTLWVCGVVRLLFLTAPQDTEDNMRLAEELLSSSHVGVNLLTMASGFQMAGNTFLLLGERQRAETIWDELRVLTERTSQFSVWLMSATIDAILAVMDGRLEETLDMARHIRARGQEEKGSQGSANIQASFADCRARVNLHKNLEELERSLCVAPYRVVNLGHFLVLAHLGRRDEVSEVLEKRVVRRPYIGTPDDLQVAWFDSVFLEAAVLTGHRPAAELLLNRFTGTGLCTSGFWYPTCILRHMGGAAALLERYDEARQHYLEAIRICAEMRFRPELALSRLQLAELLLEHYPQERVDAMAHLDFVIPEFRDMKMQPSLERALRYQENPEA
jgi:class 3 adenylate cyclase/tetratricopeptide (TPR) repeat protein